MADPMPDNIFENIATSIEEGQLTLPIIHVTEGIGIGFGNLVSKVEGLQSELNAVVSDFRELLEENITQPIEVLDLSGIPQSYSVPAPLAALPARGTLLTAMQWAAIYERALARIRRVSTKKRRAALYGLGGLGIGGTTPLLLAQLREAEQEGDEAALALAADQAAAEAGATREDIARILGLELQHFQAVVAAEDARINWSKMVLDTRLSEWKTRQEEASKWALTFLTRTMEIQKTLAALHHGFANTYGSMVQLSVRGGGSIG